MILFDDDVSATDDGRPDPAPDCGPAPDSPLVRRMRLAREIERHEADVERHPPPEIVAAEIEARLPTDPFGVVRDLAARVDALERACMSQYGCILAVARDVGALAALHTRDDGR